MCILQVIALFRISFNSHDAFASASIHTHKHVSIVVRYRSICTELTVCAACCSLLRSLLSSPYHFSFNWYFSLIQRFVSYHLSYMRTRQAGRHIIIFTQRDASSLPYANRIEFYVNAGSRAIYAVQQRQQRQQQRCGISAACVYRRIRILAKEREHAHRRRAHSNT